MYTVETTALGWYFNMSPGARCKGKAYDDYVLHISKERDVLWNKMTDIKANHIHTRTLWFS